MVTFHGLCDQFLKSRGQVLDYGGIYTDPNFWHGIQERVMGEVIDDDWRFDTLIIDEGQDFDADWFEIIRLFTTDKADMVWLEDLDQNIHGTLHVPLDDFVIYRARANYRSPQSIARFLARHLPFEFDPANDLPGLGVGVHRYGVPEDQPKRADRLVQGLLDKGFSADQITVLTCMSRAESVFNTVDTIGGLPVRRFANRYDELGNQVMTPGKLRFESINRFKGQQTPAVILTDVDPRAESLEQDLRRLFCSMTRASVRLEVLARKDNPLTANYRPVS